MTNPIILYIDKKDRAIIEKLEQSSFFFWKESSNMEKFLLALSIGIRDNMQIPLEVKDTYTRVEYLTDSDEAIICACALGKFTDPEVLTDLSKVYDFAQETAHYGFSVLDNYITHGTLEDTQRNIIDELINCYNSDL